ncbi:MAG: alpha/beta hydrolase [Geobacteraceae bacterium]|nr:alpha/beta hydrolase [Geobacteraceae bacterium]
MRLLLYIMFIFLATPAFADNDRLVKIDTRQDVTVSFYYMKREGAKASVVLLPGGSGGIGMKNGIPTSNNFLVRSRELFAGNGFNVAVVGKPSDKDDLDGSFRTGPEHIEDLRRVLAYLKKDADVPVWVVGTSMGTISAAALAAVAGKEELSGIVLTSSVTEKKTGAVPGQKLELIRLPVMVVHHELDECKICVPADVPQIIRGLKNAPIKKEVYVKGGGYPKGDPCQAQHWHGFIGLEKEVVNLVSAWIKQPEP